MFGFGLLNIALNVASSHFLLPFLPMLALAAFVGCWRGLVPEPWRLVVRAAAKLLIVAFAFLLGFQTADDRAETKAKIDRLEAENGQLAAQLGLQRLTAAFAASERDQLREQKTSADQKVNAYEAMLAEAKPSAADRACVIDDADLRFRDSLRRGPRKVRP